MTSRPQPTLLSIVLVIISVLHSFQVLAQLDVTYPVNRMVIQRGNNNEATVQIAGSYAQPLDAIEARLVARAANQGTSTDWATLQANPLNGQFNGTLVARGGWYRIEVRGLRNGQPVATDSVSRFGVGEVFAVMGHSNAQGSSCIDANGVDGCQTMEGALDDRVTVVGLVTGTAEFYQYELTGDTRYIPGLAFSQLMTFSGMSPFAKVSWFWGRMGDVLVQRINVPVLIYNAGFGGTNMELNYKAAYNIPFQHGFVNYSIRMPFVNTRNIMSLYVPSTGIRAMLLNHGENDRGNPTDSILVHHYGVIDKVRQEFNKPGLAWIIALSSFVGGPFENVRSAQNQVNRRANYQTYAGPDLDNITSLTDRPDGIHYSPTGQRKAGELWANAITDAYLQSITPYLAQLQPVASIACATGNQLQLTQPGSYSYSWGTGSTTQSITVGAGTYSARLRNSAGLQFFPPAITVPASVRPPTPTITTTGGASEICLSTGLTLTSSAGAPVRWNTGATTPAIVVTSPGTYTLQAQNAVYGCLSEATTKTITLAGADLSLSMRVSRRTPAVGDTVTFTMTVRNESGCDAGRLTIQNRLPANLSFESSADGLTVTNGVVSGTIAAVSAGSTVSRRYVARLNAPAIYQNAGEIMTSTNADPDSQAGSGTGDGQDDAAWTDLRTKSTETLTLYASPNPNQVPLPPVQGNQPVPPPDKTDLSLSMQTDRRIITAGNLVTIMLTVRNLSSLAATNITVRNELPVGFEFVSSASGMTARDRIVLGTIARLDSFKGLMLIFIARATGNGTVTNTAQITTADQPDFDSTPNNGIDKGEDDEARVDLRVLTP